MGTTAGILRRQQAYNGMPGLGADAMLLKLGNVPRIVDVWGGLST